MKLFFLGEATSRQTYHPFRVFWPRLVTGRTVRRINEWWITLCFIWDLKRGRDFVSTFVIREAKLHIVSKSRCKRSFDFILSSFGKRRLPNSWLLNAASWGVCNRIEQEESSNWYHTTQHCGALGFWESGLDEGKYIREGSPRSVEDRQLKLVKVINDQAMRKKIKKKQSGHDPKLILELK